MNNKLTAGIAAAATATALLIGSAFAAAGDSAQAKTAPTSAGEAVAQADTGEQRSRHEGKRGMRPELTEAQKAERQAQMQQRMQAQLAELREAAATDAKAGAWLDQAETLAASSEATQQRAAHGLMRAAAARLDVQPQHAEDGRAEGKRGGRGEGKERTERAEKAEPTAEQRAEMQQRMAERLGELREAAEGNQTVTAWLSEAEALLQGANKTDARAAHGLMHAAAAYLDVQPQRGERGSRGGKGGMHGAPVPSASK